MPGFNLPPGVGVNDPHINPDDGAFDEVLETISKDSLQEKFSDMDCFVAWRLGVAAFKAAHRIGAVFPSDCPCQHCGKVGSGCDCDPKG